jgi:hypothetical protein
MSTFITESDYTARIQDTRLQQIIQADESLLDDAESAAISIIRDALHTRYDVDAIFATVGDARPKQVVRWVLTLALYFLYERVPDQVVPKRVIKNYDDTLAYLLEIEDAKKSVDLPRAVDDEDQPKSKFRWGSETKLEH